MQKFEIIHLAQRTELSYEELKNSLVPNYRNLNQLVQSQMKEILEIFLSKKDKKVIQAISRSGALEESPLLRAHLWKIQLGTLGLDPETWVQSIQGNYRFYTDLVKKLFPSEIPENIDQEIENYRNGSLKQIKRNKRMLEFDYQLWGEIVLDAKRTHSVLSFFKSEVSHTKLYETRITKHSDILGRILYIWGKINPRIRYVQGMNEILAPLYYLQFQANSKYCESEVFFMFSAIMTFSIDMHMKEMDASEQGIMGRIETLNRYLKVADYELWSKLKQESVQPEHYSFRWLALLLGQEFQLDQILRIWDVLFSFDGPKRFLYLNCLCLAILKARKEHIMKNDMIGILPKLQKLRDMEVDKIIESALKMYEKYSRISIEKLYDRLEQENRQSRQENNQNPSLDDKGQKVDGKYFKKVLNYGNILKNTTTSYLSTKWSYFRKDQS